MTYFFHICLQNLFQQFQRAFFGGVIGTQFVAEIPGADTSLV